MPVINTNVKLIYKGNNCTLKRSYNIKQTEVNSNSINRQTYSCTGEKMKSSQFNCNTFVHRSYPRNHYTNYKKGYNYRPSYTQGTYYYTSYSNANTQNTSTTTRITTHNTNSISSTGNANIQGSITSSGDLAVQGNINGNNFNASGNITASGELNGSKLLTSKISSNDATLRYVEFDSDIIPKSTVNIDLGNSSSRFTNVYSNSINTINLETTELLLVQVMLK